MADVGDYPLAILLSVHGRFHYFPQLMACYRTGRQGSWSERFEKDMEFRTNHALRAFEWLTEFNRETNGKYQLSVAFRLKIFLEDLGRIGTLAKRPKLVAIYNELNQTLDDIDIQSQQIGQLSDSFIQKLVENLRKLDFNSEKSIKALSQITALDRETEVEYYSHIVSAINDYFDILENTVAIETKPSIVTMRSEALEAIRNLELQNKALAEKTDNMIKKMINDLGNYID